MAATASVGDPGGGERSVPPVTLRSVQQYKSQDEYVVVMKEDLAEWMNELYETTMTADDLFDKLETGILLCRYACTVDAAIQSRAEPVVYRKRDVVPGSFQARVNVAAFLTWCRRSPLLLPDDLLFETSDLICPRTAERNERQVALCLLEVGRRSAALKVGLPAPQLVRLEAEIDAEIRADDDSSQDCRKDSLDEDESVSSSSNSPPSPGDCSAPRRTIRAPRVIVNNDADEPSIPTDSTNSERRGSVWQRRRYRPIILVDMMSLDEMVSPLSLSLSLSSSRLYMYCYGRSTNCPADDCTGYIVGRSQVCATIDRVGRWWQKRICAGNGQRCAVDRQLSR